MVRCMIAITAVFALAGAARAESVTFAYGALQISYTRTNADGTSGPVSSGAWNQITETNRF